MPFEQMRRQKMFQPQPVPFCLVGVQQFGFWCVPKEQPAPTPVGKRKKSVPNIDNV
jgi:hypothetical protein